jgi:hypothetical protein
VHDLAAELDDLPKRSLQVGDRQVRQREAVTGAAAALVEPNNRADVLCLQALALFHLALGKGDAEEVLPEAACAVEVVRRELDQELAQLPDPGSSAKPHSRQTKRIEVPSSRIPIVAPHAGQMGGRSSSPVSCRSSLTALDGIARERSAVELEWFPSEGARERRLMSRVPSPQKSNPYRDAELAEAQGPAPVGESCLRRSESSSQHSSR